MAKMILDLNQVMFSSMYAQLGQNKEGSLEIEENLLRHICLNSIRALRLKFRKEYPEFIIACDGQNTWRRDLYPFYKHKRRKEKSTSQLNWKGIFESMTKIRKELTEYFPYRVIYNPEAEADDIIGTMVLNAPEKQIEFSFTEVLEREDILICSADKDFVQLHRFKNVQQYDPIRKKFVVESHPKEYLLNHVIRGDSGDGVPNILSDDDTFIVEGKRQKAITSKMYKELVEGIKTDTLESEIKEKFDRNVKLIDLTEIPFRIQNDILQVYYEQGEKPKRNLMDYFVEKKLSGMIGVIGDF